VDTAKSPSQTEYVTVGVRINDALKVNSRRAVSGARETGYSGLVKLLDFSLHSMQCCAIRVADLLEIGDCRIGFLQTLFKMRLLVK
jgi:hypothetical protein